MSWGLPDEEGVEAVLHQLTAIRDKRRSATRGERAALSQQHFGAGLDARHLPASWSSTANALEGLAFAAKDSLLVVDDFCPTGSHADMQRGHREADRLLRGQGNRSGRQRLRADSSLRPDRPPRGLILSTGEDVPRGQSLRARCLILELEKGMITPGQLTACQRDAREGLYADALATFVGWVAARYDAIRSRLRADVAEMRDRLAHAGQHTRTPNILADLAVGLRYFLDFAEAAGALNTVERGRVWSDCWEALLAAGADQASHQAASDQVDAFLSLFGSLLASGRAHVVGPAGAEPPCPARWGWKRRPFSSGENASVEWLPQGRQAGWVEDGDLFLDPEAAYAEAQRLATDQGEPLSVTKQTLFRVCPGDCARESGGFTTT